MPSVIGKFKHQPTHICKTATAFAQSGGTAETVSAGKTVAIWGVFASAAAATSVTISVQNQAAAVLWNGRTGATVGNNVSFWPSQPIISYDGLQIVTTGAASGCDFVVVYEEL